MCYKSFVYDIVNDFKPKESYRSDLLCQFRPHDLYCGEYGFDWFRVGDSDLDGDFHFKDIIGRYYDAKTKITSYKYQGSNRHEIIKFECNSKLSQPKMYVKKKNSFYKIDIPWKKNKDGSASDSYSYTDYIPRMTLMLGDSAKLIVIMEIDRKKRKPQKIELKFENDDAADYLTMDKDTLQLQHGDENLTITCTKEFSTVQILNVWADGKVCGKLKILPNAKKFQRDINVLFVKVKTKINDKQIGTPKPDSKELLIKTLRQALITVSEGVKEVTLDCTGWFGQSLSFTYNYCISRGGKHAIDYAKASEMRDFLIDELKNQFGDKYDGYYQMFFFNEDCADSQSGNLNGYAEVDSFYGVYFTSHNAATVGHEMFHALGLLHTFDYTDPNKSDYSYQLAKTDNMLDYSHAAGIDRKSLFYWQWRKLNPKLPNII